jgi:hypothetical protein
LSEGPGETAPKTDGVFEYKAMKEFLVECIQGENNFDKLKQHVAFTLGIGESPEMTQLHSMMLEYNRKFTRQEEKTRKLELAVKGLSGLVAVLAGKVGLDFVGELLKI